MEVRCAICGKRVDNPGFARKYPNYVCRECASRAVNSEGERPSHDSMSDSGDNPVFIDGIRCWRRYRYGGYVTMRDDDDCQGIGEFYKRHGFIG